MASQLCIQPITVIRHYSGSIFQLSIVYLVVARAWGFWGGNRTWVVAKPLVHQTQLQYTYVISQLILSLTNRLMELLPYLQVHDPRYNSPMVTESWTDTNGVRGEE